MPPLPWLHVLSHMASKSLRLSRVHFHSFAFHVIAMIERGTSAALWTGAPARSVAAGSLTATVKVRQLPRAARCKMVWFTLAVLLFCAGLRQIHQ